jgi:hypothetical protein
MKVTVMLKHVLAGAAIAVAMTMPGTAQAQDAPAGTSDEQIRARQRVATMEAILERAVSFGADQIIVQVQDILGDQPRLLGAPRVRGFRLEGHGVVFNVEVPSLQVPILWDVRYLVDASGSNAMLAELRLIARQLNDAASRALLESAIVRWQAQAAPGAGRDRLQQNVSAASIAPEELRTQATPPARPPMDDPQAEYRKQVKAALIDAILENTAPVLIGPDEWLTIAARSNVARDPLFPGDTVASATWVASIKGSTLADLRAQRITSADARKLVVEQEQ